MPLFTVSQPTISLLSSLPAQDRLLYLRHINMRLTVGRAFLSVKIAARSLGLKWTVVRFRRTLVRTWNRSLIYATSDTFSVLGPH